jgi:hypothetical protein
LLPSLLCVCVLLSVLLFLRSPHLTFFFAGGRNDLSFLLTPFLSLLLCPLALSPVLLFWPFFFAGEALLDFHALAPIAITPSTHSLIRLYLCFGLADSYIVCFFFLCFVKLVTMDLTVMFRTYHCGHVCVVFALFPFLLHLRLRLFAIVMKSSPIVKRTSYLFSS